MNVKQAIHMIEQGALNARLCALYGEDALERVRARYVAAITAFAERFGSSRDIALFSVPGRTELSGNHTDHNRGRVIAAAVDADVIAVASPTANRTVRLHSEGFPADEVALDAYLLPDATRFGCSDALIAGVADGFRTRGWQIGGFDAYTTSNVPKGSGLSSSAAFENTVGAVLNHFYNNGKVPPAELAVISQYAENRFFGKPCGLMDQAASAVGGVVTMDFADPTAPLIRSIPFDLAAGGFALCIVNTGGNHADLTPDYAAVPAEMHAVAKALGANVLREVEENAFHAALPRLREELGDRAVLRALHFFAENRRVDAQCEALSRGDLATFLGLVTASGRSSFCYLQNVYSPMHPTEQGLSLALALAEDILAPIGGACRVHGGGFAGTIQAFLPIQHLPDFCARMNAVFGASAATPLRLRAEGAVRLA